MTNPNRVLLTRNEFRDRVFSRDKHQCVVCARPAQDAHHILERRLWPDGGYYLHNGASVCGSCHIDCEKTWISVETMWELIGNTSAFLPPHLYDDQEYDKWGNPVLVNGQRVRGELFYDESVQKILKEGGVLELFTHYVKYPRTHHLPWSGNINSDDRIIGSLDAFVGKRVIITEKMDGENTSMYCDYFHARSVDGRSHPSRNWAKNFWSQIMGDIPQGWRICGENLYAKHSIHYENLPTYFMGFSVWNERNVCLSWDETLEWFNLLGITPVPVIYDGLWDHAKAKCFAHAMDWGTSEGYVLRVADELEYGQFRTHVGKHVRKNHIQTVKHWMHGQPITPNKLVTDEVH